MSGFINESFNDDEIQIDMSPTQSTQSITLTFFEVRKELQVRAETNADFGCWKLKRATYNTRRLLDEVSGEVRPSEITALMGPSAIVSGICWLRMPFEESTIQDRSSFIFFIMTYWPFNTLYDGLMSYPFERSVINKERASGSYRLSAYFLAKTCSEAPV
ncbi:unnamed protein product, partial [Rotaria sp. Silwood2]